MLGAAIFANAQTDSLGKKGLKPSISFSGFGMATYDVTTVGETTTNSFAVSRVILMANGRMTDWLSFSLMADVAASQASRIMHEYYVQFDIAPYLKVRMGQFKVPYTIESVMAPFLIGNINCSESVLYHAAIATDPLLGNTVGRDAGLMLTGDLLKKPHGYMLGYSIGVFNGTGINTRDNNSAKDVIGKLDFRPFEGLLLSASFSAGKSRAIADDPYGTILSGEDYSRRRLSLGAEGRWGPAYLRSEFTCGRNADIHTRGFYAEAWCRVYKGVEVIAGFDFLNKNTSLSEQERLSLPFYTRTDNYFGGVQWWFYKFCRLSAQYFYNDRDATPAKKGFIVQAQMVF